MMSRLLISVLFFCLLACQQEEVLRAPGLLTPVITGMLFTDRQGNLLYHWGVAGQQSAEGISKCGKIYMSVYPNPGRNFVIRDPFVSACTGQADLWITPARLSDDLHPEQFYFANALFTRPGGLAIKTLWKNEPIQNTAVTWDGTDDQGNEVPAGFYRIYFRIDDTLLWKDILLTRDIEDLPLFIKKMLTPY